ncbi:MAG: hypothetical protein D6723_12900 [Acidobacteria bacterium]|nr:MAG: hypothetical protein D6723_12900 [Acidobacteriota bacterium]
MARLSHIAGMNITPQISPMITEKIKDLAHLWNLWQFSGGRKRRGSHRSWSSHVHDGTLR